MRNFYYLLLMLPCLAFPQQENNWWFFGLNAGLDFSSGVPVSVDSGSLVSFEGCSTLSDDLGNLLMYTDGSTIWNSAHQAMPGANDVLDGDSTSAQSGLIVRDAAVPYLVYVFTVSVNSGLKYTVVDMTLDCGLGDVVPSELNIPVQSQTQEKITGFADTDRQRTWIVTFNDGVYTAYIFQNGSIQPNPVVTTLPSTAFLDDSRGILKLSPDGTRIANSSVGDGAVVADFDLATGIVSNPVQLSPALSGPLSFYGLEFSPDSQILYADLNSVPNGNHCGRNQTRSIVQYDLLAGNFQNTPVFLYNNNNNDTTRGSLQLGPDGKIYIARACALFLGVINKPTVVGHGAMLDYNAVQLLNGTKSREGLPVTITSGVREIYNQISGDVIADLNNDGCDANDGPYTRLWIDVSDGASINHRTFSNNGYYRSHVPDGSYTITPILTRPNLWNVSPPSQTVTFPTSASPFIQDFCVTPNGTVTDMDICLTSLNQASPGYDARYLVFIENEGNQISSGTVEFNYDETRTTFISASGNGQNMGNGVVQWTYTSILPAEFEFFNVTLEINKPTDTPPVDAGDLLPIGASVTPNVIDSHPFNNATAGNQIVVNSFDPNDIVCHEGETMDPSKVGERVDYTIRFENLGTAAARNVVIRMDVDPTMFDINSLIVENTSHTEEVRINSEGQMEFIFHDINLDFNDATNDGFITYSIKTNPALVEGDQFSQQAAIYFDYNMPIFTNTYVTTVDSTAGTSDVDQVDFQIFPVPADDVLNIQSLENLGNLEIFTLSGQLLLSETVVESKTQLDISSLSAGTYILRVGRDGASAHRTFMKK